ncbi:hypothetical protein [Kitasatospora sp. NPDC059327]|uniref:hypothetical protein n=1 Tax=Kitasatospora sp. NPDC059327 TaxID=3346803 RepID=UPI00367FBBE9
MQEVLGGVQAGRGRAGGVQRAADPAVARELGVNAESLWQWVQCSRAAAGASGAGGERPMAAAECEEMRRLRWQVRELELEKEILRKAAAYFAKEMIRPRGAIYVGCVRRGLPGARDTAFDGSGGSSYDNALAESFFAALKCELLHG